MFSDDTVTMMCVCVFFSSSLDQVYVPCRVS